MLDLSELMRCYGNPPGPMPTDDTEMTRDAPQGDTLLTRAMLDEIRRQTAVIEKMSERIERLESALLALPAPQRPEQPQERRKHDTVGDGTRGELHRLVDAMRKAER
ncbi:MAG: hypothetical protein LC687_07310 [Actinobacteria bacterium]|nr:hypothetical protein [Actinomycetota bacterium]